MAIMFKGSGEALRVPVDINSMDWLLVDRPMERGRALTMEIKDFAEALRVPVDVNNMDLLLFVRSMVQGRAFFAGIAEVKAQRRQSASAAAQGGATGGRKRRRRPEDRLRNRGPW